MKYKPMLQITPLHRSAGLKAFLRITQRWGIEDSQARELLDATSSEQVDYLGSVSFEGPISEDMLTRISLTLGIFKALNTLYSRRLADVWMTRPNKNAMFAGLTPLEYVKKNGQIGMIKVWQLLDARMAGY